MSDKDVGYLQSKLRTLKDDIEQLSLAIPTLREKIDRFDKSFEERRAIIDQDIRKVENTLSAVQTARTDIEKRLTPIADSGLLKLKNLVLLTTINQVALYLALMVHMYGFAPAGDPYANQIFEALMRLPEYEPQEANGFLGWCVDLCLLMARNPVPEPKRADFIRCAMIMHATSHDQVDKILDQQLKAEAKASIIRQGLKAHLESHQTYYRMTSFGLMRETVKQDYGKAFADTNLGKRLGDLLWYMEYLPEEVKEILVKNFAKQYKLTGTNVIDLKDKQK